MTPSVANQPIKANEPERVRERLQELESGLASPFWKIFDAMMAGTEAKLLSDITSGSLDASRLSWSAGALAQVRNIRTWPSAQAAVFRNTVNNQREAHV